VEEIKMSIGSAIYGTYLVLILAYDDDTKIAVINNPQKDDYYGGSYGIPFIIVPASELHDMLIR
jgi:hypothetical protein